MGSDHGPLRVTGSRNVRRTLQVQETSDRPESESADRIRARARGIIPRRCCLSPLSGLAHSCVQFPIFLFFHRLLLLPSLAPVPSSILHGICEVARSFFHLVSSDSLHTDILIFYRCDTSSYRPRNRSGAWKGKPHWHTSTELAEHHVKLHLEGKPHHLDGCCYEVVLSASIH